jgi:hypothetical protein
METLDPDFSAILQVLVHHQVDFIVVGGVCAVLHGAPIMTFDLDIVHSRVPANLDRLIAALQELGAIYRDLADRKIAPDQSHLITDGQHLLRTKLGALDVLGTIGMGKSYEDLLPHSVETDIDLMLRVRILDLPSLIIAKQEAGRAKDFAVLPILQQTLAEKQKK